MSNIKLMSELNAKAAALFAAQIRSDDTGASYAAERGLSQSTIEHFELGYANDSWKTLTDTLDTKDELKAAADASLIAFGKNEKAYDFFRSRLIFPIKDVLGEIVGFGGRATSNEVKPKYLNSPTTEVFSKRKTLYNLNHAKGFKDLVIVEGYMDVVQAYEHGIPNFAATLGVAFTEEHAAALTKLNLNTVTFAFDGDDAGYNAALKSLDNCAQLIKGGVRLRFCFMPPGSDPDDILKASGAQGLIEHLDSAISAPNFIVSHHLREMHNDPHYPSVDIALMTASRIFATAESTMVSAQKILDEVSQQETSAMCKAVISEVLTQHAPQKQEIAAQPRTLGNQ